MNPDYDPAAKGFMEQELMHRTGSSRAFVKIDFGPK
jgi:hypothetical protein